MTVTVDSFRSNNAEFASGAQNPPPDAQIRYWITVAGLLLNQNRWGAPSLTPDKPPTTMYDVATELFVAHNVVLEARALAEAQNGAVPGLTTGPVGSKSVGGVSISYAVQASIEIDAGHWNDTIYGKRLIHLIYMFGAGPIQIGPHCRGMGGFMTLVPMGPPWFGPDQGSGVDRQ